MKLAIASERKWLPDGNRASRRYSSAAPSATALSPKVARAAAGDNLHLENSFVPLAPRESRVIVQIS